MARKNGNAIVKNNRSGAMKRGYQHGTKDEQVKRTAKQVRELEREIKRLRKTVAKSHDGNAYVDECVAVLVADATSDPTFDADAIDKTAYGMAVAWTAQHGGTYADVDDLRYRIGSGAEFELDMMQAEYEDRKWVA